MFINPLLTRLYCHSYFKMWCLLSCSQSLKYFCAVFYCYHLRKWLSVLMRQLQCLLYYVIFFLKWTPIISASLLHALPLPVIYQVDSCFSNNCRTFESSLKEIAVLPTIVYLVSPKIKYPVYMFFYVTFCLVVYQGDDCFSCCCRISGRVYREPRP